MEMEICVNTASLWTSFSNLGQKVKWSPYLIRFNEVHVYVAHNFSLLLNRGLIVKHACWMGRVGLRTTSAHNHGILTAG